MTLTTTLILLALAQDPASLDLDTEACLEDAPACVKIAGAHFDAGRFADAVRLFEALIAAHPGTAKYHYFAGIAHEGAGDDTAAYLHMRRFLATAAADAPDRERATRRTAAILARTTRVTLRTPKHDEPLTLHLRRTGATHSGEPPFVVPLSILPTARDATRELALTPGQWELALDPSRLGDMEVAPLRIDVPARVRGLKLELAANPVRHQLTLELGPARALDRGMTIELRRVGGLTFKVSADAATVRRELPPGTWTYAARARGFIPKKYPIVLDGPLTVPIHLTSKWPEERRKRLKLGLGLASAGLVTGIVGGGLLGVSEGRMPTDPDGDPEAFAFARNLGDAGALSLGITTGLLISSVSGTAAKNQRRAWKTSLSFGILSTLASTAIYVFVRRTWYLEDSTKGTLNPIERRAEPLLASSGMGLGLGLLVGAIVTAAQDRRTRISHRLVRTRSIQPHTKLRRTP